ncbi:collagen alpha-1(I) chain-like [Lepus europaeus]|uniref:collagen alpha-1(I) chain-like n=1 Tax=Lepus europaeus TaxID=9983 RepID=UPI002B49A06D|nr:collagen alpha-1(I) chain-like [Lepus europaeus]
MGALRERERAAPRSGLVPVGHRPGDGLAGRAHRRPLGARRPDALQQRGDRSTRTAPDPARMRVAGWTPPHPFPGRPPSVACEIRPGEPGGALGAQGERVCRRARARPFCPVTLLVGKAGSAHPPAKQRDDCGRGEGRRRRTSAPRARPEPEPGPCQEPKFSLAGWRSGAPRCGSPPAQARRRRLAGARRGADVREASLGQMCGSRRRRRDGAREGPGVLPRLGLGETSAASQAPRALPRGPEAGFPPCAPSRGPGRRRCRCGVGAGGALGPAGVEAARPKRRSSAHAQKPWSRFRGCRKARGRRRLSARASASLLGRDPGLRGCPRPPDRSATPGEGADGRPKPGAAGQGAGTPLPSADEASGRLPRPSPENRILGPWLSGPARRGRSAARSRMAGAAAGRAENKKMPRGPGGAPAPSPSHRATPSGTLSLDNGRLSALGTLPVTKHASGLRPPAGAQRCPLPGSRCPKQGAVARSSRASEGRGARAGASSGTAGAALAAIFCSCRGPGSAERGAGRGRQTGAVGATGAWSPAGAAGERGRGGAGARGRLEPAPSPAAARAERGRSAWPLSSPGEPLGSPFHSGSSGGVRAPAHPGCGKGPAFPLLSTPLRGDARPRFREGVGGGGSPCFSLPGEPPPPADSASPTRSPARVDSEPGSGNQSDHFAHFPSLPGAGGRLGVGQHWPLRPPSGAALPGSNSPPGSRHLPAILNHADLFRPGPPARASGRGGARRTPNPWGPARPLAPLGQLETAASAEGWPRSGQRLPGPPGRTRAGVPRAPSGPSTPSAPATPRAPASERRRRLLPRSAGSSLPPPARASAGASGLVASGESAGRDRGPRALGGEGPGMRTRGARGTWPPGGDLELGYPCRAWGWGRGTETTAAARQPPLRAPLLKTGPAGAVDTAGRATPGHRDGSARSRPRAPQVSAEAEVGEGRGAGPAPPRSAHTAKMHL